MRASRAGSVGARRPDRPTQIAARILTGTATGTYGRLVQCVEVDASPSYRARVELYRNANDESRSAPLVAISPPSALDSSADDEFLHELHALWASRTAAAGGTIASFTLHLDASLDGSQLGPVGGLAPAQLQRLRLFLRARLLDVWRALTPALARMSASVELFKPAHGANMGWHKDGHGPFEYIALYLLGEVDEALGWLEVALPPRAPVAAADDDDDGEESYTVDLGADDDAERRAISRATFLPFGLTTTAGQRLVVFEDARAMHRTPLTAHARAELQSRRQRPMARVVFHGADANGDAVGFPAPRAAAAAPAAALPAGLRRAVEGYAAAAGAPSFEEALDAYVRGDAAVVAFVAVA